MGVAASADEDEDMGGLMLIDHLSTLDEFNMHLTQVWNLDGIIWPKCESV